GADACQQWLAHLLGHFDDERLALVAPRVRSAHGDVIGTNPSRLLVDYERSHSPLDLGPRPALVRPGSRVGHVPAAALVVRRAALASIGGFDTELRYGEDVDAVWRLDEAGWRCRYEPDVVVEHRPRLTWGAWAQQRYHYG